MDKRKVPPLDFYERRSRKFRQLDDDRLRRLAELLHPAEEVPLRKFSSDPRLETVLTGLQRPWSAARVDDRYFDRIFPPWASEKSSMHWTPVQVALRAVELLTAGRPNSRILDVGSGVGKFCLVGALSSRATFHGVEQRSHFVELSQAIARSYQVPRVAFFNANIEEWDWSRYSGIYLFNPFQENRTPRWRIDSTVPLESALYDRYVALVECRLRQIPRGTRIATYHGFGGQVPSTFVRLASEFRVRGTIDLWEKF